MSAVAVPFVEPSRIESFRDGAVGIVVLNRPNKLNAFCGSMREDLLAALRDHERDPGVHVILLRGAGRAFCAGGDVRVMRALRARRAIAEFGRILDAANAVARTLYRCSKVTVAALHGPAAGGGANLALACDIRIGSTACSLTQSFVKLGLGPDWGGSFLLPRIVGADRARELLLSGRTVQAKEAVRLGLVHRLAGPSQFEATVRSVCERMASISPTAVAAIKGAVRVGAEIGPALSYEREAQIRCFLTEEAEAGFSAFAGGRGEASP